jgi:hypothetical protein
MRLYHRRGKMFRFIRMLLYPIKLYRWFYKEYLPYYNSLDKSLIREKDDSGNPKPPPPPNPPIS